MNSRARQPHQISYPEPTDCPGLLFQPPGCSRWGWWLVIVSSWCFWCCSINFWCQLWFWWSWTCITWLKTVPRSPLVMIKIECLASARSSDPIIPWKNPWILPTQWSTRLSLLKRSIHLSITTPFLAREAHSWSRTVWNWEEALCSFAGSSTIAPDHYDKTYIY